jgi:hypothetical protein
MVKLSFYFHFTNGYRIVGNAGLLVFLDRLLSDLVDSLLPILWSRESPRNGGYFLKQFRFP